MSQLGRNVLANFAGNGWVTLMSLAFVPVYIHILGIEAYGLIGFFTSFQALLALLDLGLGFAVNRELARLSAGEDVNDEMRHLVRTLEVVYWCAAPLIAGIVALLAPLLAHTWFRTEQFAAVDVQQAIVLMGLVFAVNWPSALYSGALMGLQRQVFFNGLRIVLGTLRSAGAALILWLVSPTLTAFLLWQLGIAALSSLVIGYAVWRCLPPSQVRPRFALAQLKRIWKFAAGLSGIAVTVVILTQADKIVLSKLLGLKQFGYYALAWAVAGGLGQLVRPVFSAYYPRLSRAVAANDEAELSEIYHQGSQLMSLVLLPISAVVACFSYELVVLWTGSSEIAANTHFVLSILVAGTALNGLMNLPYALQLAHGWTTLALVANVIAILVLVPLIVVMSRIWGPEGAALGWFLLNAGYVLVSLQVMHRKLLPAHKRAWYVRDVGLPLTAVLCVSVGLRVVTSSIAAEPTGMSLAVPFLAYLVTVLAGIIAVPLSRQFVRLVLSEWSRSMKELLCLSPLR